ncbi:outer membrane beta-barrel protein [Fulvivirga sedimenti]|uniref:Porin n=1 Tax=Fulvivirga sedimenti TaxID=2879465 RepID=A0A9X1HNM4_9BACT|nr:outer membrane beta-barrel protein [Fulvivirga sedimenti]MCA6075478.1 porin [Fulvivirga sedimenti]MCA6076655.1 porin [Fulvivirga sedimenti]MCA6077783.1 porin [Fulvivirga sedimenti]
MKNVHLLLTLCLTFTFLSSFGQDKKDSLTISGSVDTYYTYDFSGQDNIGTSFADDRNSISIGMVDVALSQTLGKASFVGELSFGPRSFKSIPLFDLGDEERAIVGIQNLYVSYAFNDVLSLTAGYMGTFVGYEVISPVGNFNYSTSYLFTNGPFQNSGLKADITISDNFAIMVGIFNDWNVYNDENGVSDFGAQIFIQPVEGWSVYLNMVTGSPSGTIFDLTTGFQISEKFYLGLNAADYSIAGDEKGGYTGVALYPQFSISEAFSIGLREEFFSYKEATTESGTVISESESVFASTVTANYSYKNFRFIGEVRLDNVSFDAFMDSNEAAVAQASQITLAAVYAF